MPQDNLPATKPENEIVKPDEVIDPTIDMESQVVLNMVKTDSRADKITLINAMQNADYKIADMVGKEITIKGVYAEKHYSEKKGKPVCRVLIIDNEGKSYATGSFVFMNSLKTIFDVLGEPTEAEPLTIKIENRQMPNGEALIAKPVA